MPETPEQKDLEAAGWRVRNRDEADLTAGRGIAVREFQMKSGFGFADYLLYLDRKALGAVEAKPGGTLTGVEAQSAKYERRGSRTNCRPTSAPFRSCSSPTGP